MTEYKSKEEAMEAAETFIKTLSCNAETYDTSKMIEATVDFPGGHTVLQSFPYPKPKPIPEEGQAVICPNGTVFYSHGILNTDGELEVCCKSDLSVRGFVETYEPVEIVRGGRHAKALELLRAGTKDVATCDLLTWNRAVQKLLADEPEKGESE